MTILDEHAHAHGKHACAWLALTVHNYASKSMICNIEARLDNFQSNNPPLFKGGYNPNHAQNLLEKLRISSKIWSA
ncbi:hypothetical protein CR513_50640, partial [Mucuna pruriens]